MSSASSMATSTNSFAPICSPAAAAATAPAPRRINCPRRTRGCKYVLYVGAAGDFPSPTQASDENSWTTVREHAPVKPLDYPLWLRAAHFFNFLFLSLLVRSGLEILSAHPRLYWNEHCTPGSEWLKFTKKQRPKDRLWTASDEETSFPSAIALPGHERLGLGRHWHFLADFAWLLTGLTYIAMLFITPEWRRLIPTSWQIVPDAGRAMLSYLTLHIVRTPGTYNALQQLSYASVIFVLAPFSIATGVAMSPAVAARFPWYIKIFHGRQSARSLHFLALCTFIVFFIGHVTIVALHGFRRELALIVLGETHGPHLTRALIVWLSGLTGILIIHVVTTLCSHRRPHLVQRNTQAITDALRTLLFGHEIS